MYVGVCIGAVTYSVVFLAGSAYRCTVVGEGSEIFSKIAFCSITRYVLVQYILVHNMRGTGDRVVWVCSIRCCCIGSGDQTPFGVEHTFFQKSSIRFRLVCRN